jgi:Fur family ferric uptake transcriptional regulator/Fur family peroxide stress response transcriptional regulator
MDKRCTIQRTLVLETVRALRGHVTADEVYDVLVPKYPSISRGTVYRNLNVLAELGEIRKIEIPGDAVRYDYLCHEHYHVQCAQCSQVFDVDMDYLPDLQSRVKDAHGFTFTGHDIFFKGICPECKANAGASSRKIKT